MSQDLDLRINFQEGRYNQVGRKKTILQDTEIASEAPQMGLVPLKANQEKKPLPTLLQHIHQIYKKQHRSAFTSQR